MKAIVKFVSHVISWPIAHLLYYMSCCKLFRPIMTRIIKGVAINAGTDLYGFKKCDRGIDEIGRECPVCGSAMSQLSVVPAYIIGESSTSEISVARYYGCGSLCITFESNGESYHLPTDTCQSIKAVKPDEGQEDVI